MELYYLILIILVEHSDANCQPLDNTNDDILFGKLFVPNPSVLQGPMGVLTSSNYPNNYNQNEQCGYLIQGPENSKIKIEFTDYDVGMEVAFGVFDGNPTPFGGVFTPFPVGGDGTNQLPAPFESNSNFVAINWSAGDDPRPGWRLKYSVFTPDNDEPEKPLIVVDSATSTFFLAVLSVIVIFISGAFPV